MALRSLIETVACHDIISRRSYVSNNELQESRQISAKLFAKIQAMRKVLNGRSSVNRRPSTVAVN
jgi:hypothetical protein